MFYVFGRKIVRSKRRKAPAPKKYLMYKEYARALVHERIAFWNQFYNLKISRVAIRNSRSRWGSCSKKGNLNFNYKLALLPLELTDYIIVHELCHLREFNHSPTFWSHVAETHPHHRTLRKQLREISKNIG